MTRLSEAIRSILADRQVTYQEVMTVLAPIVTEEGVPDPTELQPLVDAWKDRGVRFEADAATRVNRLLTAAGYELEPPAAQISATRPGSIIRQRPLSAPDTVFERLATATGHRDSRIAVAVADMPIDFRHPLLRGREWVNPNEIPGNDQDEDDGGEFPDDINGWDFVRNRGNLANATAYHGNASGALVAQGTDRIRIMAMTVMEADTFDPLFRSLDYAVRKGARVISLSTTMERPENADRLRQVLARYPHTLFVMAAGNEGRTLNAATARATGADVVAPNLMVVGAATPEGGIWRGDRLASNTGAPYVTVAARGVDIMAPHSYDNARRGYLETRTYGTSVSTPQVANLAAKLMLLSPRLTAADVSRIIVETSDLRVEWAGHNRAGGTINEDRAMFVAAITGLVVNGVALDRALDQVGVSAAERTRVRASVIALMPRAR